MRWDLRKWSKKKLTILPRVPTSMKSLHQMEPSYHNVEASSRQAQQKLRRPKQQGTRMLNALSKNESK